MEALPPRYPPSAGKESMIDEMAAIFSCSKLKEEQKAITTSFVSGMFWVSTYKERMFFIATVVVRPFA